MKGFRVAWYELNVRKKELYIGVKPHKTGCRCPHCGRRGEIVAVLPELRQWRDVALCGMQVIFFIIPRRFFVQLMGGFRSVSRGRRLMRELHTGLNTSYWYIAS